MTSQKCGIAARAAWLSYIGGFRQEDIAERLGVSRVKVNRLIAQAHRDGLVRIIVDGSPDRCVDLEREIAASYHLTLCSVAPDLEPAALPLKALASAGARFLLRALERDDLEVIGVGQGRTLSAVVDALPRMRRTDLRFVSLLGSLTRHQAANPFDVIYRLAHAVGCEGYFLPVPFVADSVVDRGILMAQQGVRRVVEIACSAQLYLIGIGAVSERAYLSGIGMMTQEELDEVERAGAVGEVLGQFIDSSGQPVDALINARVLGIQIDDLHGKEVVAVAGGFGKARAIAAALETGALTGLITDETTAEELAFLGRQRRCRPCSPALAV